MKTARVCSRCVIDDSVLPIRWDKEGVCHFCHIHDALEKRYPLGKESERQLAQAAEKIKAVGRNRKYDCVVGLSGGRDTSYCLYIAKKLGLRPLAVHFDNGWDSEIAKRNIQKLCAALEVDLHSVIADWNESRELTNCTIRASVPYIDMTDDVGIASALYRTAAAEGVRYIILSHSFRMEGINPLLWNYVDARFCRSLIKRFCRIKLKKFRNVDIHHILYWAFIKRIRVFNITNYYDDRDEKQVEEFLKKEFAWEDTGGHHYDNEIFGLQSYYSRHKFGFDFRMIEFAALVRSGVLSREQAFERLATPPSHETPEVVAYCLKKQGISQEEFSKIMAAPPKYFIDYPTYYPFVKMLRRPWKWLCDKGFFPGQAYEKYFET